MRASFFVWMGCGSVATAWAAGCSDETPDDRSAVAGMSGTSSTGRAGAGSSTEGESGAPTDEQGCVDAMPFSSNLESCEDTFVHRVPGSCPFPTNASPEGVCGWGLAGCTEDADCTQSPVGYCVLGVDFVPTCLYPCITDDDCAAGNVCACDTQLRHVGAPAIFLAAGVCTPATCTTDSECEDGALCIGPLATPSCGARPNEFHCQSPSDECRGPADCPHLGECVHDGDRFACTDAFICEPR